MKLEKGVTTELRRIRTKLLTAVNCPAKREAENTFSSIDREYRAIEERKRKHEEKTKVLYLAVFNLKQRNP